MSCSVYVATWQPEKYMHAKVIIITTLRATPTSNIHVRTFMHRIHGWNITSFYHRTSKKKYARVHSLIQMRNPSLPFFSLATCLEKSNENFHRQVDDGTDVTVL